MSENDFQNTEMEPSPEFSEKPQDAQEINAPEGEQPAESPVATLIVKKGDEMFQEWTIEELTVTIGRKSKNNIVLDEKNVSRKHAVIDKKEDMYVVMDLESTGGTLLNGEKVTEAEIHTGDVIIIGNFEIQFDSGLPEDERTVYDANEQTMLEDGTALDEDRTKFYEEPEAALKVIKADSLEGEFTISEDETILGRDEDADITIEDNRVSRHHCSIKLENGAFVLSDLGSSNGTFVNGQKTDIKTLENGDRIQVGSAVFEFQAKSVGVEAPRSRINIFVRGAIALGALAVLSLIASKIIPSLQNPTPQAVILQKVWEYNTQGAVAASPSLGDLNGDGFINLVASDVNGVVYGLDARQGGLIWNSEFTSAAGPILSSPLLADINKKDGTLDAVVGTATKGVFAIDGGTMRRIWVGRTGRITTSSPASADVNADGTDDVIVGTQTGEVICLDGRQGGAVWTFKTRGTVRATPVLSDLNNDGVPDVVIASTDARVYALNGKNGSQIWVHVATEEPSTAAIGYLNKDKIPDVVVVTPSRLIVLEGEKGSQLWAWSVPESARPTKTDPFLPLAPALADFNKDGQMDVVVSTPGGHLFAVDGGSNGQQYIWDFGLSPARKTAPAMCDFNMDGILDVAIGDAEGNVILIDGETGHQLNRLQVGGSVTTAPVIGDLTSEGIISLAVGTQDKRIIAIQTQTRVKKNKIVWNN